MSESTQSQSPTPSLAEPDKYFQSGQWWSAKKGEWIGEWGSLIIGSSLIKSHLASDFP